MKHRRQNRKAFTLVEMMIASAIAFVAIAMSLSSFMMLASATTSSAIYTRMHGEIRHAMDLIERDIRAGIGVAWAYNGHRDRIVVLIKTTTGDEYVYYYKTGTTLYRWRSGQVREVAEGLSDVDFTMLDDGGNVTTTIGSAAAIDVTLTASSEVLSKTCSDSLRTRIAMRNRG
jgi:hypothetical protein